MLFQEKRNSLKRVKILQNEAKKDSIMIIIYGHRELTFRTPEKNLHFPNQKIDVFKIIKEMVQVRKERF